MRRELHPDQDRYADTLTALTGLHRDIVRAWVGAASGFGVAQPGHGYVTGGMFPDVDTAAAAAAALVDRHGLRAVNVLGPLPQLVAIGQHAALPGTVASIADAWAAQGAE